MNGRDKYRIFPFLWMRGEPEEVIRTEMEKIHACGITGVCVESRPHPDFMGPGWWKDMDIIVEEAERRDMKVWVLDDAHFPTGYANGAVKDHPHLGKLYLANSVTDVVGPAPCAEVNCRALMSKEFTWQDLERHPKPPLMEENALVSVTARRFAGKDALSEEVINLTDRVDEDGMIRFDVPAGQWRITVCYTTRANGGDPEYLNPLDGEAVKLLIDTVYVPHYERYGNRIAGFFSDEPCMGNVGGYDKDTAIGRKRMNLPWSKEVPAMLERTLGQDWRTLMPFLWADCPEERLAAKVRFCYMDAITELYGRNFSGQLGQWCEQRGLEYVGHVVEDNGVHSRLGCGAGHFFRSTSGQHMAGIDVIGSQVTRGGGTQKRYGFGITDGAFFHHALVPMGATAAALDPKKQGRLMCELFGAYGWAFGVRDMKWVTDFLLCRGVNRLVPHAFSMKEYPDPDCPPHFYARGRNLQFKHFGDLMHYADRMCERFSGGVSGARTAVLYPAECDWMGECMQVEAPGRVLDENQVDFWVLPEDALCCDNLPEGMQVDVLVIPESKFLTARMASVLVKRPAESVVFVNELPHWIPDAEPEEERNLLELLGRCKVCPLEQLGEYCREMGLCAGVAEPRFEQLHIYRYRKGGMWDYMVFNESADRTFSGMVTFPDGWQVELTLHPFDSVVLHDGAVVETSCVSASEQGEVLSLYDGWHLSLIGMDGSVEDCGVMESLAPVSTSHPRFAGLMRYERDVNLKETPADAVMEAEWLYETADLYVDECLAATRLTPPYRFDLSGVLHAGVNKLRLEVACPPIRDALNYDLGPFTPNRCVVEPTGMFGKVELKLKK